MLLEDILQQRQIDQAQQQIRAQQMAQLAQACQQHPANIGALGRIIAHNMRTNAIIQDALKPQPPDPNAPPPRITVQDILDYHILKDHCQYCQKPWQRCPIH